MKPSAVGVDGCRAGWFWIALDAKGSGDYGLAADIATVADRFPARTPVFIDMPIGLADASAERGCDTLARSLLGARRSSVFNAPVRSALQATDHASAVRLNRAATGKGVSVQAFNLAPRIIELDALMRTSAKARAMFRESHPELSFRALAGGHPMTHAKRTRKGFEERLACIERAHPQARAVVADAWLMHGGAGLSRDDVLDAMANALIALAGPARWQSLPARPPRDEFGLPMRIVHAVLD